MSNFNNPILRCWICKERLVINPSLDSNIVTTACGHVYHYDCIAKWYKTLKEYRCAVCGNVTDQDCTRKLLIDMEDDSTYLSIITERNLLHIENYEQWKQLNVFQIRLILLNPDKYELLQKFDKLKWNDLTCDFQEDLRRKLNLGFSALKIGDLNLSFLSTESLIGLISCTSVDSYILSNILKDYYSFKRLNGTISLEDCKEIFKYDLLESLRVRSKIPSLQLHELPVSLSILNMLIENNVHIGTNDNDDTVLKIVELYFEGVSSYRFYELCKMIIISQICLQISTNIKLFVPCIDRETLYELLQNGTLKWKDESYIFAYESVKFYLIGILFNLVKKKLNLTIENCHHLFFEGVVEFNSFENYFVRQYNGFEGTQFSKVSEEVIKSLSFTEKDIIDILAILALMKLKSTKDLVNVMRKFESFCTVNGKNLWEIGYQCVIGSYVMVLKLPHFACLRGDLPILRTIHNLFVLAEREYVFEFRSLIHAYTSYTLNCGEEEISILKQFTSFLLSLDEFEGLLKEEVIERTPSTVHLELLMLVMKKGLIFFQKIWNMENMLLEVGDIIGPEELCNKMRCLYEQRELDQIIELYCSSRPTGPTFVM